MAQTLSYNTEYAAREAAQRLADRHGRSVYLVNNADARGRPWYVSEQPPRDQPYSEIKARPQ